MWVYNSPVGRMVIRHNQQTDRFDLFVQNEYVGNYSSADKAADDVSSFSTGFDGWDELEETFINAPHDIGEWEKVAG